MMDKRILIDALPVYRDEWITIDPRQTVRSIMREVLNAHKEYTGHYDLIAEYFDEGTTRQICENLYSFCKRNIRYKEESDDEQTSTLPAGLLIRGHGDCKNYAGFCGGVLDALNRRGRKIDWFYRFASYHLLDPLPHHVFVVVKDGGSEIWIDPTPGVEDKQPIWIEDKKVKNSSMALYRNIAGIGDVATPMDYDVISDNETLDVDAALSNVDLSDEVLTEKDYNTIATLLMFQVIDENGNVNMVRMDELEKILSPADYAPVAAAYNDYMTNAQIGNIFGDIWRGVKAVSLALPRNAFLGLVALNVFAYGSKIKKVLDTGGESADKLLNLWYKLGGNRDALRQTANSGAKKKPILAKKSTVAKLGDGGISAAALLASAATIIAAVMPLVASLLKKNNQDGEFANLDAQIAAGGYSATGSNSIMSFIQQNPIPVLGGLALLIYVLWSDKD